MSHELTAYWPGDIDALPMHCAFDTLDIMQPASLVT